MHHSSLDGSIPLRSRYTPSLSEFVLTGPTPTVAFAEGVVSFVRIAGWCAVWVAILAFAASMHPMVRNVYRAFRPSASYDTTPPEVPEVADPAILVFTKTNGFRHFDSIDAGVAAIKDIAARRGWSVYHTENGAVFDAEILSRFRVVAWHNASGAPLNEPQRQDMRDWMRKGGGFVGIHAALDNSHASWDWYLQEVVGAVFIGHPLEHQRATIRVERPDHASTQGLEASWSHFDEWYSFDRSVRDDQGVEVLASVDESTYEPRLKIPFIGQDLSMGDHPVIWTRSVGQGRVFLSALGHVAEAYRDPSYLSVLEGAIEWAGQVGDLEGTEPMGLRASDK